AVVHEFQMALLRGFKLLVAHVQFSIGRVLRDGLSEKMAEYRGCGHVAVNVDGDLIVMHKYSLLLSESFYEVSVLFSSCRRRPASRERADT
ncbi:MAG: hypothetical protein ACXWX7_17810, partial [Candidatus Binatia bacterium]